jgi:ribonuclease HII
MKIPNYKYERELWSKGFTFVVGVDEVGRGAWAGPLLAAAVILPKNKQLKLLRDSKVISEKQRNKLAEKIKKEAVAYAYGIVSVEEINEQKNIYKTNTLALTRAIENLLRQLQPEGSKEEPNRDPASDGRSRLSNLHVLLDGRKIRFFPFPYTAIVKGDSKSVSIAAASILAKVKRDWIMKELEKEYPEYQLGKHKGYGTKLHQKILAEFGPSPIHRLHYKPFNPKLF